MTTRAPADTFFTTTRCAPASHLPQISPITHAAATRRALWPKRCDRQQESRPLDLEQRGIDRGFAGTRKDDQALTTWLAHGPPPDRRDQAHQSVAALLSYETLHRAAQCSCRIVGCTACASTSWTPSAPAQGEAQPCRVPGSRLCDRARPHEGPLCAERTANRRG